ncbi:hypothetical protein [Microbispora sp. H10885]|nr:hypothetical protein [Microbispora sp. H10885]
MYRNRGLALSSHRPPSAPPGRSTWANAARDGRRRPGDAAAGR